MKLLWSIALIALMIGCSFELNVYAQDDLIQIKKKGGVTIIKDKTKPLRREFEAIYAEGVRAMKNYDVEAMLAKISPDFIAILPDGQIMNYETIKNYIRRGSQQFVEIGDLRLIVESLTAKGNEVIVEARQYFPRKQRLRDGKIHDVFSSVLQTETWVKTTEGWKKEKLRTKESKSLQWMASRMIRTSPPIRMTRPIPRTRNRNDLSLVTIWRVGRWRRTADL